MKENDISIPNFYFKIDGQKIWDSILKYVGNIIRTFYKKDSDIQNDFELIYFIKMLTESIRLQF
jgi:hypothetical protein